MAKTIESQQGREEDGGVPLHPKFSSPQNHTTDQADLETISNQFTSLSLTSQGSQTSSAEQLAPQAASEGKTTRYVPPHSRGEALDPRVPGFQPRHTRPRKPKKHDLTTPSASVAQSGAGAASRRASAHPESSSNDDFTRKPRGHFKTPPDNAAKRSSVFAKSSNNGRQRNMASDRSLREEFGQEIAPGERPVSMAARVTAHTRQPTEELAPSHQSAQATAEDSLSSGQPSQELATSPRHVAQAIAPGITPFGQPNQELVTPYRHQGGGYGAASGFSGAIPAPIPPFASGPYPQPAKQSPVRPPHTPTRRPQLGANKALGGPGSMAQPGSSASPSREVTEACTSPSNGAAAAGNGKALTSKRQKRHVLPVPMPSAEYMAQTNEDSSALPSSRRLLVILDLNGTLGYRKNSKAASFKQRPGCEEFIAYLFAHHCVLVWSSALLRNVQGMCQRVFTAEQLNSPHFLGIWGRENLNLTPAQSKQKIFVYKQLSWVWKDQAIQGKHPISGARWDQTNTVLIDDTISKAAAEPHNLIMIDEFMPGMEDDKVLGRVQGYLGGLETASNVSATMKKKPFDSANIPGEMAESASATS